MSEPHTAADGQHPALAATLTAIRVHHRALGHAVVERSLAVQNAVDRLAPGDQRADLVMFCRREVLPHAAAEEDTLYRAGAELPGTALLVRAMLDEHTALRDAVDELATARTPGTVAGAAAALRGLFTAHLAKENDLLLPALVDAGVDLAAMLDGMHEILGSGGEHAGHHGHGHGDCGCGSGCGCASDDAGAAEGGCGCQQDGGGCGCGDAHATGSTGGDVAFDGAELDVRSLVHAQRHARIFAVFGGLGPGEAFVLVNDHDPKGLRRQFDAELTGRFTWDYLQAGPDVWRVRIGRARVPVAGGAS